MSFYPDHDTRWYYFIHSLPVDSFIHSCSHIRRSWRHQEKRGTKVMMATRKGSIGGGETGSPCIVRGSSRRPVKLQNVASGQTSVDTLHHRTSLEVRRIGLLLSHPYSTRDDFWSMLCINNWWCERKREIIWQVACVQSRDEHHDDHHNQHSRHKYVLYPVHHPNINSLLFSRLVLLLFWLLISSNTPHVFMTSDYNSR